jgi:molybdate transport system permease protein
MLARLDALDHLHWPATVVASFVVAFPIMYQTRVEHLRRSIPLCSTLRVFSGHSEWRSLRRILLPLAWPGIVAGTVQLPARGWSAPPS